MSLLLSIFFLFGCSFVGDSLRTGRETMAKDLHAPAPVLPSFPRVILFGLFWANQHKGDVYQNKEKGRHEIFELTTVKAAVSFFV